MDENDGGGDGTLDGGVQTREEGMHSGTGLQTWGKRSRLRILGQRLGIYTNYTFTITPTETFHFPPISLLYLMLLLDFLSYNTYFGGCPKRGKESD